MPWSSRVASRMLFALLVGTVLLLAAIGVGFWTLVAVGIIFSGASIVVLALWNWGEREQVGRRTAILAVIGLSVGTSGALSMMDVRPGIHLLPMIVLLWMLWLYNRSEDAQSRID